MNKDTKKAPSLGKEYGANIKDLQLTFYTDNSVNANVYTTDEVIAECSGYDLKAIKNMIYLHKKDIEEFGVLHSEDAKPLKGSKGGRPTKIYHFNEQQATYFITLLENTETVNQFKKDLVHQFYAMRDLLRQRTIARESSKPVTRTMTDAIKEKGLDSHMYANYNRLALKVALGQSSKEIKRQRNIPANKPIPDYLTPDELEQLTKVKQHIATLIELNMPYDVIKAILGNGVVTVIPEKDKRRKGA